MTGSQLKLIACILMVIDHIGAVFYPDVTMFRLVGRLAFPIFAWFIVVGYKHTKNVKIYLKRLFIFALISQIPFYLAFKDIYKGKLALNVFVTLFLGVLTIYSYEKSTKNNSNSIMVYGFLAELMRADYGFYGILTIFIFYKYYEHIKKIVKGQVILNIGFQLLIVLSLIGSKDSKYLTKFSTYGQPFSLLALFLINKYNGQRGKNIKYFFYIFYPAHLLIIYLVKRFLY